MYRNTTGSKKVIALADRAEQERKVPLTPYKKGKRYRLFAVIVDFSHQITENRGIDSNCRSTVTQKHVQVTGAVMNKKDQQHP